MTEVLRERSDKLTELGRYLLTGLQLFVLFKVVEAYELQVVGFDLAGITKCGFVGFLVHYWLPPNLKTPGFLLVTLIGLFYVFQPDPEAPRPVEPGADDALFVLAVLLVITGVLILKLHYYVKLAVLVAMGVALVLMREGLIRIPESSALYALPIIGAMFMFRLLLYLHELRFETERVPLAKRIAYFFMLPGVAIPLFPVVDYKTFKRSDQPLPGLAVQQRGVRLMVRGVLHLMIYRVLYDQALPDPQMVSGLLEAVQYMAVKYALIIQLSGIFHFSVGMLGVFGYNLPEIFNNYFLADGFGDLWRRINTYWRDFVMKVFYYPIFFKLRKAGNDVAVVLSVIAVFAITWLLHSWQWFWIKGDFLTRQTDMIFWGLFGLLVAANALHVQKRASKRAKPKNSVLTHSLRILGMFLFMSVLWSFWTYPDVNRWLAFVRGALSDSLGAYLQLGGILLAVIAVLIAGHYLVKSAAVRSLLEMKGWKAHTLASLSMLVPLGIYYVPTVQKALDEAQVLNTAVVAKGGLSDYDRDRLLESYYEELVLPPDISTPLTELDLQEPEDWETLNRLGAMDVKPDMLQRHLKPNVQVVFKGAPMSTNRWGMRDKEYSKSKPPGVYRFALVGGSSEMGSGVRDNQVIDALVEERMNQAAPDSTTYEILNFSVTGYHLIQKVKLMESRVPEFEPDVLLYISPQREEGRLSNKIPKMLRNRLVFESEFLVNLLDSAGIDYDTPPEIVKQRIAPFTFDIVQWGYSTVVDTCRAKGIIPVWVFMPTLDPEGSRNAEEDEKLRSLAETNGFLIMDLSKAFEGHDLSTLQLAEFDRHPNAKAHQLLANELYLEVRRMSQQLGLKL